RTSAYTGLWECPGSIRPASSPNPNKVTAIALAKPNMGMCSFRVSPTLGVVAILGPSLTIRRPIVNLDRRRRGAPPPGRPGGGGGGMGEGGTQRLRAILRLCAGLTALGLAGCGHVLPIAVTFRGETGVATDANLRGAVDVRMSPLEMKLPTAADPGEMVAKVV